MRPHTTFAISLDTYVRHAQGCSVRRIFNERARFVIYVESADMERMEVKARSEGRTLVEWARETLVAKLGDNSSVREKPRVRVAKRGTGSPERSEASVLAVSGQAGPYEAGGELGKGSAPIVKLCRHGLPACTVCG
jgi:hypothetical protein